MLDHGRYGGFVRIKGDPTLTVEVLAWIVLQAGLPTEEFMLGVQPLQKMRDPAAARFEEQHFELGKSIKHRPLTQGGKGRLDVKHHHAEAVTMQRALHGGDRLGHLPLMTEKVIVQSDLKTDWPARLLQRRPQPI